MDSVLNIEKCKFCSGLVRIENTSYEVSKICTCCGYYYNKKKLSDENDNTSEIENLKPCGAYKLVTLSGVTKSGTLGENLSEDEVLQMFNLSDTSILNMNKTYINYRNPETNEFKVIFGNGKPETYDEFINSIGK